MKNKCFLFSTLLTLIFLSCSNKFANETRSLNNYLNNKFNKKIPGTDHTYLFIASFRCSGCVESALQKISENIKYNSSNKITIITYDTSLLPETIKNKVTILLDTDSIYESIGISIANIALIKTSKSKIYKIRVLNLDDTDKIIKEEF